MCVCDGPLFHFVSIETMEHILDTNMMGNIHSIKVALAFIKSISIVIFFCQASKVCALFKSQKVRWVKELKTCSQVCIIQGSCRPRGTECSQMCKIITHWKKTLRFLMSCQDLMHLLQCLLLPFIHLPSLLAPPQAQQSHLQQKQKKGNKMNSQNKDLFPSREP